MVIEATVFSANKPGGNVIAVCIDHNDDTAVVALSADPAPSELRAASTRSARVALPWPNRYWL